MQEIRVLTDLDCRGWWLGAGGSMLRALGSRTVAGAWGSLSRGPAKETTNVFKLTRPMILLIDEVPHYGLPKTATSLKHRPEQYGSVWSLL